MGYWWMWIPSYGAIAYALKPQNAFNMALQTSASKIGTLQHDISQLLRSYLGNSVRPECLADIPGDAITQRDFNQPNLEVCDAELAIGSYSYQTAVAGGRRQHWRNFLCSGIFLLVHVCQFYQEVVHKMVVKFPFGDTTIQDLSLLDPRNSLSVSVAIIQCFCQLPCFPVCFYTN